jgi:hypothetical protein
MSALQISLEKLRAHADQLTPELVARLDDFERGLWKAKRPGRAAHVHLGYIVQTAGGKAGLSVLPLMAPGAADAHGRLLALACVHHGMKVLRFPHAESMNKYIEGIRDDIRAGKNLEDWRGFAKDMEYLRENPSYPWHWNTERAWRIHNAFHTVLVPLGRAIDEIPVGGLPELGRQCGVDAYGHLVWMEIIGDSRYRAAREVADRAIDAEAQWCGSAARDTYPVEAAVDAYLDQMEQSLMDHAEGRAAKLVETCLNEAARRAR